MKWPSTLALLMLTVAVGAYVSLVELKRTSPERHAQLTHEVADLPFSRITVLDIVSPAGSVTLERQQDAWRVTAPITAPADEVLVARILMHMSPLYAARTLSGSPDHPLTKSEFGLEPPKASLRAQAGTQLVSLHIGDQTAVGTQRYAMLEGSPNIYTINGELFDLLTRAVESGAARDPSAEAP